MPTATEQTQNTLLEALFQSGLPANAQIRDYPGNVFRGFSEEQLLKLDPRLLGMFGDAFGRYAEQGYPKTAAGLKFLMPSDAGASFTNAMYEVPRLDVRGREIPGELLPRQWGLGVNPERNLGVAGLYENRGQSTGFFTGGTEDARGTMLLDPVEGLASHEFGHAIDHAVDDWYKNLQRPSKMDKAAYREWMQFRRDMTSGFLNLTRGRPRDPHLLSYAEDSARAAVQVEQQRANLRR